MSKRATVVVSRCGEHIVSRLVCLATGKVLCQAVAEPPTARSPMRFDRSSIRRAKKKITDYATLHAVELVSRDEIPPGCEAVA